MRRTAVRAFQVAFEIVPRMRRPHCPIAFPVLTNYIGEKMKKLLSLHLSAWKVLKCCRDNWLSRGHHTISDWKRPFLASYWLSVWTLLLYFSFNNWEMKKGRKWGYGKKKQEKTVFCKIIKGFRPLSRDNNFVSLPILIILPTANI